MARVAVALGLLLVTASAAPAPGATAKAAEHCDTHSPAARADRSARPGEVDLSVFYSAEPSAAGSRVTWTLRARNRTRKRLGLGFPTSQYADVLVRKGGARRYMWSYRRAFFQAFTGRTLAPRETYVCTLGPDRLELEPGRYEVLAYLNTYRLRVFTRSSLLVSG